MPKKGKKLNKNKNRQLSNDIKFFSQTDIDQWAREASDLDKINLHYPVGQDYNDYSYINRVCNLYPDLAFILQRNVSYQNIISYINYYITNHAYHYSQNYIVPKA